MPQPEIRVPVDGHGKWLVAQGRSAAAGRGGRLLRYQVAVESDVSGVDVDQFAARVSGILADPRSWTAGDGWRLQLVGPGDRHDFTIYLATPATRDRLCAMGHDRYTSCRKGDNVVRDYLSRFAERPMEISPPFTFDLVPAGFTVDNVTPPAVTFAPPGVEPSAGFDGKVAVLLDAGSTDGTQVTAEGVTLHRSLGDGRTLTVQVPASVALSGADLARFAAGIRPTGSAVFGNG